MVTATPTPGNEATALFQNAEATAAVIVAGTSTPIPFNLVTATPLPTETATPILHCWKVSCRQQNQFQQLQ
ncbi:MAG: hypothetical protein HC875_38945 [Anaerolineales bacterium]|nr:hypothetical protein [Anaerolineales bacterium]